MNETAVIHPYIKKSRGYKDLFLKEAISLVKAIELDVVYSKSVGIDKINSKTYLRSGFIDDLKQIIINSKIKLTFLNACITPIQQRNLENATKCKIIDRTGLILEIFGSRARSNEGKLSVSLASLKFQKSRLVRSWTHLERQRGGAGFMGGPGEKQIESDKRQLTESINRLRKKINKINKIREIQRYRRIKNNIPIISLVGYTNSGKSTLFNLLTKSSVLSKNMLFASLDSTIRSGYFNGLKFILVDTVGFIRDLPTTLIDAFKSTLDEITNSDLIIHVRDISDVEYLNHKTEVLKILDEIGINRNDKRIFEVLNKTDLIQDRINLHNIIGQRSIMISAKNGSGIDLLKKRITTHFNEYIRKNVLFK
ncbi:MAG: GTPase HflX [Alphaproteobacteria bacterium]